MTAQLYLDITYSLRLVAMALNTNDYLSNSTHCIHNMLVLLEILHWKSLTTYYQHADTNNQTEVTANSCSAHCNQHIQPHTNLITKPRFLKKRESDTLLGRQLPVSPEIRGITAQSPKSDSADMQSKRTLTQLIHRV